LSQVLSVGEPFRGSFLFGLIPLQGSTRAARAAAPKGARRAVVPAGKTEP
jgi:hypothetical protein